MLLVVFSRRLAFLPATYLSDDHSMENGQDDSSTCTFFIFSRMKKAILTQKNLVSLKFQTL